MQNLQDLGVVAIDILGAGAYSVRVFWPVLGAGVASPSRTDEKL